MIVVPGIAPATAGGVVCRVNECARRPPPTSTSTTTAVTITMSQERPPRPRRGGGTQVGGGTCGTPGARCSGYQLPSAASHSRRPVGKSRHSTTDRLSRPPPEAVDLSVWDLCPDGPRLQLYGAKGRWFLGSRTLVTHPPCAPAAGTVYGFGAAKSLGTAKGTPSPVAAIAGTPTGGGYLHAAFPSFTRIPRNRDKGKEWLFLSRSGPARRECPATGIQPWSGSDRRREGHTRRLLDQRPNPDVHGGEVSTGPVR